MESYGSKGCPNCGPGDRDRASAGEVIGHGSFRTQSGRNQRWLCGMCRRSYCASTGTVYVGLHCTRDEFDRVARMRVEGVSISGIARITGRCRSTITRSRERAAGAAKRFNDEQLRDFEIKELQADELCTFIAAKTNAAWVFTTIEVSSRLWPARVVGRRSYRNTERIFNQTVRRGRIVGLTLVTTDGFELYQRVVRRVLGVAAVYGQVVKTRRNNRVQRVQRSMKLGTAEQFAELLLESEDSETLNTSFADEASTGNRSHDQPRRGPFGVTINPGGGLSAGRAVLL